MSCQIIHCYLLSAGLRLHFLQTIATLATEKKTQTRNATSRVTETWTPHSPQTGVPAAMTAGHHCCGSVGVDAGVGAGAGDDADGSRNA